MWVLAVAKVSDLDETGIYLGREVVDRAVFGAGGQVIADGVVVLRDTVERVDRQAVTCFAVQFTIPGLQFGQQVFVAVKGVIDNFDAGLLFVQRESQLDGLDVGLDGRDPTIAELLKGAGYRTGLFGKWHLGYDPKFNPVVQGFDEFVGFVSGNVDYHSHIDQTGEIDWWKQDKLVAEEGYSTDLITAHGLGFIERHKDAPFFLYYPMLLVHAEHKPTPDTQPHSLSRSKSPDDKRLADLLVGTRLVRERNEKVEGAASGIDRIGQDRRSASI